MAARASAKLRVGGRESPTLAAVRAWGGPAASASQQASSTTYGIPAVLVRAAAASTTGDTSLASVVGDSSLLFDIRPGGGGVAARPTLKRPFESLRGEGDWASFQP